MFLILFVFLCFYHSFALCPLPSNILIFDDLSWFFRPASSTNNDFDTRYILGRRPGSTDELLKCSKTRADVQIVPASCHSVSRCASYLTKNSLWNRVLTRLPSSWYKYGDTEGEREREQAGITVKTDLRAEKYFFLVIKGDHNHPSHFNMTGFLICLNLSKKMWSMTTREREYQRNDDQEFNTE